MRPRRANTAACRAFFLAAPLAAIASATGEVPACKQNDAGRRRSGFSCEQLHKEDYCSGEGNLVEEARETCEMTCGVGCRQPCAPDETSRRRSGYSCLEMFNGGFCGAVGNLGSEMEETCRATCWEALGCLPPCESDHTSRRRSGFSCQQILDNGFCVGTGNLGVEAAETCRTTCGDALGCSTEVFTENDESGDANNDTDDPGEPSGADEAAVANDSPRGLSLEHGVGLPLGVLLICCCSVCIYARVCRAGGRKGQGEPLTSGGAATSRADPDHTQDVEAAAGAAGIATPTGVVIEVDEGEDAGGPSPGQGPEQPKKKRVKKLKKGVSFNVADQAKVIDDDDDDDDDGGEEEARPKCPSCQKEMLWSDFNGPPYDTKYGWGCRNRNTCHNWKENCGSYRWHCRECSEDLCERCSGLIAPAPAKRGVISMWQPKEKIVDDEDDDDEATSEADSHPGADAPARGQGSGEQDEQQEAAGARRTFAASIFSRAQEPEGQGEPQEAAGARRTFAASIFSRAQEPEGQVAQPRPSVLGVILQGSKTAVEARSQEVEQQEPDKSEQQRRPSNGSAFSSSDLSGEGS